MCDTPCSFVINENAQGMIVNLTGRRLVEGPNYCAFYMPCFETPYKVNKVLLEADMQMEILNELEPEKSRIVVGPKLVALENPWENLRAPTKCPILDLDDYLVIRSVDGTKKIKFGPGVYSPSAYGEVYETRGSAKICPVNHYLVYSDADSNIETANKPITHLRGPVKFYPKPFQTLLKKTTGITNLGDPDDILFHPCIEVTAGRAVHLQRANGVVELLDKPQFYMPEVGEKVLGYVERIVMLTTNFCIVRRPDGDIQVMHGADEMHRAFFLKPFEEFVIFALDKPTTILSTLPTYLGHDFRVRTLDNVMLELVTRIQYKIFDVKVFCSNPIDFYTLLRNQLQNALLDRFAQVTLSIFMQSFSSIAAGELRATNETFHKFGIEVSDIQILTFGCLNVRTQQLLMQDIHTNVEKQNELRAKQAGILIQEQVSEVKRKQKDLEIQLVVKDNEMQFEKASLGGKVRLQELEIEIKEEEKRTILLEVKRGNDMLEAEFEGRALGHSLRYFMEGIDPNLTKDQKKEVFHQQMEIHRRNCLYEKVNMMTMYPSNVEVETIQVTDGTVVQAYSKHVEKQETYAQKKSSNQFKKTDHMSKADANLAKIREQTAQASAPADYSSNSSSDSWFSKKVERLPTPPPAANKYDSSTNTSYGAPAPPPKAYVSTSLPEPQTTGTEIADKTELFLDFVSETLPSSSKFNNFRGCADRNAIKLKNEGDAFVQAKEYVEAVKSYSECLAGFSKFDYTNGSNNDKEFVAKVYSNRSLSLMLVKRQHIKKQKGFVTMDRILTAALEAALDDCHKVLNFLDPGSIKSLVRAMTLSSDLKKTSSAKELAERLKSLGAQKVGQANYELAEKTSRTG